MKIGIITFTDGRARLAKATDKTCHASQEAVATYLRRRKHDVVTGRKIVWNHATAESEARRIAVAYPDVVVLNYCVWAFPDLTARVVSLIPEVPVLLVGSMSSTEPGWPAFLAAAGTLEELGLPYGRVAGDIRKTDVRAAVDRFLRLHHPDERARGERAAIGLHGLRYGQFDGPTMTTYTGHIDASQWLEQFGVQVCHRSQLHLWQMARKIRDDRVEAGLDWLERRCGRIDFDNDRLTPGPDGTLARQIRLYLAIKDFCRQEGIDFCGLTGLLDLTEWPGLCIPDVAEALLNGVGDWEQADKPPLICAASCDSNGALTMRLLHHLTNTPVLLTSLRHYHEKEDVWALANSGRQAPWFTRRSKDPRRNWKECRIAPASPSLSKAGGGTLVSTAAPAPRMTFARLVRRHGRYVMHIFAGSLPKLSAPIQRRLAKNVSFTPHAYARFDAPYAMLRDQYCSQHIHAVIGDHVPALAAACDFTGIEPAILA